MTEGQSRRSAMIAIVAGGVSTILASLAGLVGFAAVPRAASNTKRWRKVASTLDISDNEPAMVVLSSRHPDGWYETRKQSVVFVDRDGDSYRALSAVCTHLGCRVHWDGDREAVQVPVPRRRLRSRGHASSPVRRRGRSIG